MPNTSAATSTTRRSSSLLAKAARLLLLAIVSVVVATLILVAVTRQPQPKPPGTGPEVGSAAPRFTLRSPDGKSRVTFGRANDKPSVLIFGSCT